LFLDLARLKLALTTKEWQMSRQALPVHGEVTSSPDRNSAGLRGLGRGTFWACPIQSRVSKLPYPDYLGDWRPATSCFREAASPRTKFSIQRSQTSAVGFAHCADFWSDQAIVRCDLRSLLFHRLILQKSPEDKHHCNPAPRS
jgi:hypothetical protein